MKAITLTEPWASLVVAGRKTIETRSWPTSVRERIAIHAAKAMPGFAREAALEFGLDPDQLPRGLVLGSVQLVACARTEEVRRSVRPEELVFGDFGNGRWAWLFVDPLAYEERLPARGSLGWWRWERA